MRTILLLPFFSALVVSAHASEIPTGSIRGTLFDASDSSPLGYAIVTVLGTKRGAMTDERGHFQIDGVPAGDQVLRMIGLGMNELTYDVTIVTGDTTTIRPLYLRPFGLSNAEAAAESIGVDVPWATGALTCAIRPTRKIFHVGDHPDFQVSITNRAKQPLDLVYAVDGSEGGRFPQAKIHLKLLTIEVGHIMASPGQLLRGRAIAFCANTNGLSADDFVHLEPGQTIDPYAKGWKPTVFTGTFEYPGRYQATFIYSTKQSDVRGWLGFGQTDLDPRMSKLFRTVPMVELTDSTEFEVAD